jgi:hypothetical protein
MNVEIGPVTPAFLQSYHPESLTFDQAPEEMVYQSQSTDMVPKQTI